MDYKKDIISKIQEMSGRYSVYEIFADWVKMYAIAISNMIDINNYVLREREYIDVARKYSKQEMLQMSELSGLLALACEENMEDVLGYIYMHLEISSARLGQFFTPYHVCQLMAQTYTTTGEDIIEISEPSCGAGGNIIALAEKLKADGVDYQRKLSVTCQDLDWKAIYMCYLQLSLYGVPAVVVQGDTLCEPFNGKLQKNVYVTPMKVLQMTWLSTRKRH